MGWEENPDQQALHDELIDDLRGLAGAATRADGDPLAVGSALLNATIPYFTKVIGMSREDVEREILGACRERWRAEDAARAGAS